MITFADIVKGKFLEEFSAISMSDALIAIALSFALSLFIVFIYRATYAGVNYSRNFTGCLMMLSMVTTMVILVISSNRDAYAETLKQKLEAELAPKKIFMTDVFCGCGANIGPGMVGVYYLGEPISEDLSVEKEIITRITGK